MTESMPPGDLPADPDSDRPNGTCGYPYPPYGTEPECGQPKGHDGDHDETGGLTGTRRAPTDDQVQEWRDRMTHDGEYGNGLTEADMIAAARAMAQAELDGVELYEPEEADHDPDQRRGLRPFATGGIIPGVPPDHDQDLTYVIEPDPTMPLPQPGDTVYVIDREDPTKPLAVGERVQITPIKIGHPIGPQVHDDTHNDDHEDGWVTVPDPARITSTDMDDDCFVGRAPDAARGGGAMSDYTPSTAEIRFRVDHDWEPYGDGSFDRWLAAHDAEVARQAEARLLRSLIEWFEGSQWDEPKNETIAGLQGWLTRTKVMISEG